MGTARRCRKPAIEGITLARGYSKLAIGLPIGHLLRRRRDRSHPALRVKGNGIRVRCKFGGYCKVGCYVRIPPRVVRCRVAPLLEMVSLRGHGLDGCAVRAMGHGLLDISFDGAIGPGAVAQRVGLYPSRVQRMVRCGGYDGRLRHLCASGNFGEPAAKDIALERGREKRAVRLTEGHLLRRRDWSHSPSRVKSDGIGIGCKFGGHLKVGCYVGVPARIVRYRVAPLRKAKAGHACGKHIRAGTHHVYRLDRSATNHAFRSRAVRKCAHGKCLQIRICAFHPPTRIKIPP